MFETEFDKPEWGNSWSDFLKSILAQSLAHSNAEFSAKVYKTSMFGKMEKQTNPKKCSRNSGLIQSYFFMVTWHCGRKTELKCPLLTFKAYWKDRRFLIETTAEVDRRDLPFCLRL